MFKNSQKGFTLIELLVVIAIIGILASIVLASLNSARAKGADAAVKGAMANMAAQAELYYDNNGNSYGTATDCLAAVFTDPIIVAAIAQITSNSVAPVCNSTGQNWAMSVSALRGAATPWCVDNSGWRKPGTATAGKCI
jgi:prepilin-type N-terminal cleavage/methylation domain-containing protein